LMQIYHLQRMHKVIVVTSLIKHVKDLHAAKHASIVHFCRDPGVLYTRMGRPKGALIHRIWRCLFIVFVRSNTTTFVKPRLR
jgi:hypothetical protein